MRSSVFFILQVSLCSLSMCFASDSVSSFRLLIVEDSGSFDGIHEADAKDIQQTFKIVAEVLKVPMYTTQLECSHASTKKVRNWCSTIQKHDIVVMYYSGPNPKKRGYHGVWPLIAIGKKALSTDWIAKEVHAKHARLSLVFVDCYDKVYRPRPLDRSPCGNSLEKIRWKPHRRNLRHVWMSARGSLTMCSKKHGEVAHGVLFWGGRFGAFTEALLLAIEEGLGRGYGLGKYYEPLEIAEIPHEIHHRLTSRRFYQKEMQRPLCQSAIREGK